MPTRTVLLIPFVVGAFAGCLTDPGMEQDEPPYELHIKTKFDPEKSHQAAMVPPGSPAAGMNLRIYERTLLENSRGGSPSEDWESDPGCPLRQTGDSEFYDCEHHPVPERVRLPPVREDQDRLGPLVYPLAGDGDIVLLSKQPFSALISFKGPYSEELLAMRTNPDDFCRETVNVEGHEGVEGVSASLTPTNSTIVRFDASGEITLLWWGYCNVEGRTKA